MTSLPQLNPNVAGPGLARSALQPRHARAFTSWVRPSSRSPWRWRWTAASSNRSARCTIARARCSVAGRTINDTHPFDRACSVAEIMKESSNIGTAQIAAQLGSKRQQAFLEKMGFLAPVAVELKERGRTLTPGTNWNEMATMTVGYGHGIAVTPLHLATGYATLFNGGIWRPATLLKVGKGHPVAKGHRVFSEDTSYKMRALLRLVVTDGTGKQGRRARLSRRRQDRHRREISAASIASAVVTTLRRRFPDGRTSLCDRRHARRPQGHRRHLRLPHRRLERRAGESARPSAGSRRCSASAPTSAASPIMAEVLPFVRKTEH